MSSGEQIMCNEAVVHIKYLGIKARVLQYAVMWGMLYGEWFSAIEPVGLP